MPEELCRLQNAGEGQFGKLKSHGGGFKHICHQMLLNSKPPSSLKGAFSYGKKRLLVNVPMHLYNIIRTSLGVNPVEITELTAENICTGIEYKHIIDPGCAVEVN